MARKYREMPDINVLKDILKYEPETGIFYWRTDRNHAVVIGSIAGGQHPGGYWMIGINGKNYAAHRLAWFYHYEELSPFDQVDHYNLNKIDNRLSNLRIANNSQNKQNSGVRKDCKSGIKGAHRGRRPGTYTSKIIVDGKMIWLGTFKTAEEAHDAYCKAAERYYGDFFRKK